LLRRRSRRTFGVNQTLETQAHPPQQGMHIGMVTRGILILAASVPSSIHRLKALAWSIGEEEAVAGDWLVNHSILVFVVREPVGVPPGFYPLESGKDSADGLCQAVAVALIEGGPGAIVKVHTIRGARARRGLRRSPVPLDVGIGLGSITE